MALNKEMNRTYRRRDSIQSTFPLEEELPASGTASSCKVIWNVAVAIPSLRIETVNVWLIGGNKFQRKKSGAFYREALERTGHLCLRALRAQGHGFSRIVEDPCPGKIWAVMADKGYPEKRSKVSRSPPIQPSVGVRKNRDVKSSFVGVFSVIQTSPPLLVFKIVPLSAAIHPQFPMKKISKRPTAALTF